VRAIAIVSSERYSGKSSLTVGLALELRDRGYSVGYMKPVGSYPIKVDGKRVDEDAYFISEALGLTDSLSDMTPFFLTWETLKRYMRKRPGDPRATVKRCYERLSAGKDIMLLEGAHNFVQGRILGLSSHEISDLLGAGVLLLDTFNEDLTTERILAVYDYFRERFLGVVLNWVPERRRSFVENQLKRFLEENDISLFGSFPTDRVLRSISVKDLAEALDGRIVCATGERDELVESMMVGAMGQEQALRLFRERSNKVVVTGGDRSDIQLAALQTSTKALILTGGLKPNPQVIGQAEEMRVPIVLVGHDTATTVEMVEAAIGRQKVYGAEKIDRIRGFIRERLDLDALLMKAGETETR